MTYYQYIIWHKNTMLRYQIQWNNNNNTNNNNDNNNNINTSYILVKYNKECYIFITEYYNII